MGIVTRPGCLVERERDVGFNCCERSIVRRPPVQRLRFPGWPRRPVGQRGQPGKRRGVYFVQVPQGGARSSLALGWIIQSFQDVATRRSPPPKSLGDLR
jgi:hypothetical protein